MSSTEKQIVKIPENIRHMVNDDRISRFKTTSGLERIDSLILYGDKSSLKTASNLSRLLFKSLERNLNRISRITMKIPEVLMPMEATELGDVMSPSKVVVKVIDNNLYLEGPLEELKTAKEEISFYFEESNVFTSKMQNCPSKSLQSTPKETGRRNVYKCPYCVRHKMIADCKEFSSSYFLQHVKHHCDFARNFHPEIGKRTEYAKAWCVDYDGKISLMFDEELVDDDIAVIQDPTFAEPIIYDVEPLDEENLQVTSLGNIVENYCNYLNSRRSGKKLRESTKLQRIRRLRKLVSLCKLKTLSDLVDEKKRDSIVRKVEQISVQGQTQWYYIADVCFLLFFLECDVAVNQATELLLRKAHLKWTNIKKSFTSDLLENRAEKQKKDIDKMEDGDIVNLAHCFKSLTLIKAQNDPIEFLRSPSKDSLALFYSIVALNYALKSIIRPSIFCNMTVNEYEAAKKVENFHVIRVLRK